MSVCLSSTEAVELVNNRSAVNEQAVHIASFTVSILTSEV